MTWIGSLGAADSIFYAHQHKIDFVLMDYQRPAFRDVEPLPQAGRPNHRAISRDRETMRLHGTHPLVARDMRWDRSGVAW